MARCSLPGCTIRYRDSVTLHVLPSNKELRQIWVDSINIDQFKNLCERDARNTYVCQKHFEPHFIRPSGRLEYRAYPTLITPTEVSSGSPAVGSHCLPPRNEHDYSRKIRSDHTYCVQAPRGISASFQANVYRKQEQTKQIKGRKVHPTVGNRGTATIHKDAVRNSRSSEPFDYGEAATNSPASVKSENSESAEDWYRGVETRVCRICLRVGDDVEDMTPLLQHGIPTELGHTMQRLLPDIVISVNDALPKQLCGVCADDALRAERFLKQARHTQQRLAGLERAAVAEDVHQSWLLSRYLPSGDDEDAFVSLRFDGENLELENSERVEETVAEEECVKEEIRVEEKTCTSKQTSDETKVFEEDEIFATPYEQVVIQSFDDKPSLDAYNIVDDYHIIDDYTPSSVTWYMSYSPDDAQALELPSTPLRQCRSEQPDSPLATGVYASGSPDDGQAHELPSVPFELRRREHHDPSLNTRVHASNSPEDLQALPLPSSQFKRRRSEQPDPSLDTIVHISDSPEDVQALLLPSSQFKRCRREYPDPSLTTRVNMSKSPNDGRALESTSAQFKRRRREHPDPSLASRVYVSGGRNDEEALKLTSPPVKRRRRKSPLLPTSWRLSDSHDDEEHLDESLTQFFCEPSKDDSLPGANWGLCESLDAYRTGYVTVKKAEQLFRPELICAHCGYKTRLKSRLRQHMRARHDRRLAPRLRPRVTPRARS